MCHVRAWLCSLSSKGGWGGVQIKREIACITWMIKYSAYVLECVWFLEVWLCWMNFLFLIQLYFRLCKGSLWWWQNILDLVKITFVSHWRTLHRPPKDGKTDKKSLLIASVKLKLSLLCNLWNIFSLPNVEINFDLISRSLTLYPYLH